MAGVLLCLGLAGCRTHPTTPLGGGYEEIKHTIHTLLPGETPPRIALVHLDADGQKTMIWPSLYCANEVVNGEVAIFVADKASANAGADSIHPRLFAVETPGLPVDITEEVLWRWARANSKDVYKTFNRYSLATPEQQNGGLKVNLEFWSGSYLTDEDWPETGELNLDWVEVTKMMRSVEAKGVREKDLRWQTSYIGEKF